jgi:hypothetical protein
MAGLDGQQVGHVLRDRHASVGGLLLDLFGNETLRAGEQFHAVAFTGSRHESKTASNNAVSDTGHAGVCDVFVTGEVMPPVRFPGLVGVGIDDEFVQLRAEDLAYRLGAGLSPQCALRRQVREVATVAACPVLNAALP